MPEACLESYKSGVFPGFGRARRTTPGGLGPGPGPRPRTRPKAKAQAPKLQHKARPGPKPGNAPDLHDSSHASGIHNLFALDLARLRTPEAVPSLFQVVHKSLETMPN